MGASSSETTGAQRPAPESEDAADDDEDGETDQSGIGPSSSAGGVGVGWAQSEQGAMGAAMSYATASQSWLYLSDEEATEAAASVMAERSRDRLAEPLVQDLSLLRDQVTEAEGLVWYVVSPLAVRVLNGEATVTPKTGTGPIEALRQLRVARSGAMKARIAAINQLHSLCDTAPDAIRAQLAGLAPRKKIAVAQRWRPGTSHSIDAAAKRALNSVARRWQALDDEIRDLDRHIKAILDDVAPELLARHGVGYDTAGQLLVTAGDNPQRMRNEASYAALCGSSPVQASSGRTTRHRLNRGGDRHANSALWTIALTRMVSHPPTRAYVQRRTTDGLSKREIMRCLKRYIARELFPHIQAITTP